MTQSNKSEERTALLKSCGETMKLIETLQFKRLDLKYQIIENGELQEAEVSPEYEKLQEDLFAADEAYMTYCDLYTDLLPEVTLSRCPFTGELYILPFDSFGIDGLWWDSDEPVRPDVKLPDTFLVLTGAMHLTGKLSAMPFIAMPGPGKPYVHPSVLLQPQVKAVVMALSVGPHTAWVIAYFADPLQGNEVLVNEWGLDVCFHATENGDWICETADADPDDFDFDLAPWIQSGKLLWIAPEDAHKTLRSDLEKCPYLNLQGTEQLQYVQDGQVWTNEETYETMADDALSETELQELVTRLQEGAGDE